MGDIVDRERSPVKQENDDRLAQRDHRFHQLFLTPNQVQAGAIAHVIQHPSLARSLLVSTDRQHDHVGFLGHAHRFGNLFTVLHRIARHHFILVPRPADSDLAALAVEHLHLLADFFLDAFQHRDILLRYATVPAQQNAIRVWSNHSNSLDRIQIQRRDVVFVLQQRDRFMRRL